MVQVSDSPRRGKLGQKQRFLAALSDAAGPVMGDVTVH